MARSDEYARAKAILDAGRHPTYVGREQYANCVRNGGGGVLYGRRSGRGSRLGSIAHKLSSSAVRYPGI